MKTSDYHTMIRRARVRHARMAQLRSEGMSLPDIGKRFNCSKQRVHQILTKLASKAAV